MPDPRLICELNLGTIWDLPDWSAGAHLKGLWGEGRSNAELVAQVKEAGFEGIQGGDPETCRAAGLSWSTGGRFDRPEQADEEARKWADQGQSYAAIHLGTEIMDDATVDALVGATIEASTKHKVPIFIETHRATSTQDGFRTVGIVERNPAIRFNGDFSHWYTGHEMPYGDFEAKCDFYKPVFDRVRVFHGRIGNSSHMQVGIRDGRNDVAVDHFKEIWRRCFAGYIASGEHDLPCAFAPELLPAGIRYAREFIDSDGQAREESDRWLEALSYVDIVRELFAETLTTGSAAV